MTVLRWLLLCALTSCVFFAFYLTFFYEGGASGRDFQPRFEVREDLNVNPKFRHKVPLPTRDDLTMIGGNLGKNVKELTTKHEVDALKSDQRIDKKDQESVSERVHVFYYPWYGSPDVDGRWLHWNHDYIQHWDKKVAEKWPKGHHTPPDDIGSTFYPSLGPYSSKDPAVIAQHMQWIAASGAGVLAVSWYPPSMADTQGQSWHDLIPSLLNAASVHGLKVALHIEPYEGRSVENLRENIRLILKAFGDHPAFYTTTNRHHSKRTDTQQQRQRSLPLLYIYDSYLIPASDWQRLLKPDGAITVRHSELDCIFVGLVVKRGEQYELQKAGFDGYYTYFAADRFTYGSTTGNWNALSAYAKKSKMLFIPSVGPGYNDLRVRPWNGENVRDRKDGEYFRAQVASALTSNPDFISITSFNEWHEGTQIEPAVAKVDQRTNFEYPTYKNGSMQYIHMTRELLGRFR